MYCYQCQETAKGQGCTLRGVCGKPAELAELQDMLIYLIKGISKITVELRRKGLEIPDINRFITDALFMTITNANFDQTRFVDKIREAYKHREYAKSALEKVGGKCDCDCDCGCQTFSERDKDKIIEEGKKHSPLSTENEDIRSLKELITYGLKGMAAYAEHAYRLGYEDKNIYSFMQEALAAIADPSITQEKLMQYVLACGEQGVRVMALLDKANTTTYGNPVITKVNIGVRKNSGILISGHDLHDLEDLLEQTKDTGVDVYTHSEMLPAHYYPYFKKYPHLAGNYGDAWWNQVNDFESFNGVFLFTTNCIVPPRPNATYADRVFTTGSAGFEGFPHIPDRKDGERKDFTKLIEKAKKCPPPTQIEKGEIVGGFAHNQVFELADKVVEAVKSGAIKKFVVMAGCDGRMKSREYYTEFAKNLPKDWVILTAGCAKYRYNKLPLGDINGIPRVLDAGQCNDSYSLALIAIKLKEIFNLSDINELPIVYNIAWYEQKAVLVLLALLSLGVKNIHLGPTLPAFLSPGVAKILVEKFAISGISAVDEDLKKFNLE